MPSSHDILILALYAAPALCVWAVFVHRSRSRERAARARLDESTKANLLEPPSLHPHINPNRCAGCATCVSACPEEGVLGLIDGKAVLVSPASCIGHGACKTACPMDAITLVFGTETRGIDIPHVNDDFETNVPGMFIAGELGGMGLIRNAVTQGRQAIDHIAKRPRPGGDDVLDIVIVGAGPAGFSATLAAKQRGLRSITIEQETLGGTVAHYPRGKIVMTAPMLLPMYGTVKLGETTKEALLELWRDVERKTGVQIRYAEQMEAIDRQADGFRVRTSLGTYVARSVLLCIGRRGTPRKLQVPGEDAVKVVYRLTEPEQYTGKHVLVVGGGDSALEAALTLAEEVEGTTVTLSYRGRGFNRAKPKNRDRIDAAAKSGALTLLLESSVRSVEAETVNLSCQTGDLRARNDAVIVCAGGILPTGLLTSVGIRVETKHGTA